MPGKKQKTRKGQEIPVPKRGDFLRDFQKVSKAKRSTSDSPKK